MLAYLQRRTPTPTPSTASLAGLRDSVFAEIKARTQETDLSVPVRKGGWWYYSRTVEGQQYSHPLPPGWPGRASVTPPAAGGRASRLDGRAGPARRQRAGGRTPGSSRSARSASARTGGCWATPPTSPATSASPCGSRTWHRRACSTTRSRARSTAARGHWTARRCSTSPWTTPGGPTGCGGTWSAPPAADDVIVFEEPDERFWVGVGLTRSERYLVVRSASKLTSEAWLLDAADPAGELRVVAPRRQGVEYDVEHQPAPAAATGCSSCTTTRRRTSSWPPAPAARPANWEPLIGHRADTRLLDVDAFAGHFVVWYRRDGLTGLAVYRGDGAGPGDPVPRAALHGDAGRQPGVRVAAVPAQVRVAGHARSRCYDCDVATGELTLLKRRPVLPLPGERAVSARRLHPAPRVGGGRRRHARSRSPWSARRGRRWTAAPRACSTATAATRASIDPYFSDRPAVAARPRLRLRHRARPRRRRDGPALVRGRQAAAQDEHVHRLRRVRRAPGPPGLDVAVPAGRPGRVGRRPADGRGGQPRAAKTSPGSSRRCRSWTR